MKAAKAIGGAARAGLGRSLSLEEGGAAQARGCHWKWREGDSSKICLGIESIRSIYKTCSFILGNLEGRLDDELLEKLTKVV